MLVDLFVIVACSDQFAFFQLLNLTRTQIVLFINLSVKGMW